MLGILLSVISPFILPSSEALTERSSISKEVKSIVENDRHLFFDSFVLVAQESPSIEENGYVFEFLGCESTPNTDVPLTCNFMVENSQDSERYLRLYGNRNGRSSRIIDASGNEIIATIVQLGNDSGTAASTNLPSRIPIKASLQFSQAPEGGIRIIDLLGYDSSNRIFDVEFRFPG